MSDLNNIALIGRMVRDPEIKSTGKSDLAKFTLASSRKFKDQEEVLFIDCIVWGALTKVVQNYCNKGKQIAVVGRLKLNQWEKDGVKRSKHEIHVNDLTLLGGDKKQNQNTAPENFVKGFDDAPF